MDKKFMTREIPKISPYGGQTRHTINFSVLAFNSKPSENACTFVLRLPRQLVFTQAVGSPGDGKM